MTAKNVGGPSVANDVYLTPRWAVEQCLEEVVPEVLCVSAIEHVLDPCTGEGIFPMVLHEHDPDWKIEAHDLLPQYNRIGPWPQDDPAGVGLDFLTWNPERRYDLVISNPPYSLAMEFVVKALAIADHVIFILRQGFLSSAARARFFRLEAVPSYVWLLPNRPNFMQHVPGKGGDSADYCWVCWGPERRPWAVDTLLRWLTDVPQDVRKRG